MLHLHRVHETLLHLVEDHDPGTEGGQHEDEAVDQPAPAHEITCAQKSILEGLEDGGDGVQAHEGMDRDAHPAHAARLAEGVHDGSGVHPELDQEGKENLEVAVLGREGGDDGAETQGQTRNHQDEERKQEDEPGQVRLTGWVDKGVNDIHDNEEAKLDAEPQEVTDDIRNGHHQPREIHLSENAGVVHERIGRLGDTIGEILPEAGSRQIKERPRNTVGRNTGDAAEHNHVHDDREGRLDNEPEGSQDGLLVLGDDVPLDKQGTQVAVLP